MDGLTTRQKEVLDVIKSFINKKGYSPTQQEVADHFGFAVNAAKEHIAAIKKKGYITIERGSYRSIRVVDSSPLAKYSTKEILAEIKRREK